MLRLLAHPYAYAATMLAQPGFYVCMYVCMCLAHTYAYAATLAHTYAYAGTMLAHPGFSPVHLASAASSYVCYLDAGTCGLL